MLRGTIISFAMQTSTPILLLAAALACASPPAAAQERIFIQVPALMAPGAKVDPDVLAECNLPALVARQVLQKVHERHPHAVAFDPSTPAPAQFIRIQILAATMVSGVGMRQIFVRAEVVQNDLIIASVRFNDRTSASPGMGLRLCDVMDHVAEGIGKRVALWADTSFGQAIPASMK